MIETTTAPQTRQTHTSEPRLGFIGVGWIGRNRMEAIARSGLAQIAAISDPSAEALDVASQSAPKAKRCGSFEELLDSDLDGIVIATPSALHAEQSIAALQSGKAVFCQKPLARNAAETKLVVDAARAADRLLGVDLSYRFTVGLQRIRELIQSGAIGNVYAVEAVFHNAYGPDKAWFYDARLAGGGCLLDLGIHLVDAVLWCLGSPTVEAATGALTSKGAAWNPWQTGVEDFAAGLIRLENGASVQLGCSWRAPAGCDARIEITFFGTNGGASFRNVNGSFYDFTAEHFLPDRTRKTLAEPPDAWGGRAAVDWAQRLSVSRAFDPEVEQLVTVARTLDQLYGRNCS